MVPSSTSLLHLPDDIDSGGSQDTISNTATSAFPYPSSRRFMTLQPSQEHRLNERQAASCDWSEETQVLTCTRQAHDPGARARFDKPSDCAQGHIGGAENWTREPMEQLRFPDHGIKYHNQLYSGQTSPNRYTQQQRPLISSGLPTSYNHFRNGPRSASCSALRTHTFRFENCSALKTKEDDEDVSPGLSSPQIRSPSPVLYFTKQDRSWSDLLSGKHGDASGLPRLHSRTHSLGTSSNLYDCSRSSSFSFSFQTHPTSTESSEDPSRSSCRATEPAFNGCSPRSRRTTDASASVLRCPGKPLSGHGLRQSSVYSLQPASPASTALRDQGGSRQQVSVVEGLRPSRPLMRRAATSFVTTEQVIGPQYLEPINSCEGYFFPRPRLRTRSLNTVPSEAVDRLHVVPERFWQRHSGIDGADNVYAARASSVNVSGASPITLLRASSQFEVASTAVSERDPRLTLHKNMPPPPLPTVSSVIPRGPAHPKPLPPTPWPNASPEHSRSQDSACSLDLLEASELLERNKALELERLAWREEHRTSLGVGSTPFLGRLSPCHRESPPLAAKRRVGALSGGMTEAEENPVRVHRMRNKDGTEQTLLLVRARRSHPLLGLKRSSTSELRDRLSATARPSSLVKHFSHCLGGLSSTRQPMSTSSAQGTSVLREETLTSPHTPARAVLPLKKGRRLVTDETIVIGRQREPPEWLREHDSWTSSKGYLQPEVQMGIAISDTPNSTAGRTMPARSGYRATGTRDEIKALLNEGDTSTWPQKLFFNGVVEAERLVPSDLLDIDPGTAMDTSGELVVSESPVGEFNRPDMRPPSSRGNEARLAASAESGDSGNSSGRHGDFTVWDASNVSLDNLFFRPPQRDPEKP